MEANNEDINTMPRSGLMNMGMNTGPDVEEPNEPEEEQDDVDAKLVYELAFKLLSTPEGKQNLVKTVQGASDVGTAIGKLAGVLIAQISDQLEQRDMAVDPQSILGSEGALARVLTAIYQKVNEAGIDLPMQDTIVQAYEAAESDMEQMYNGNPQ